MTLSELVHGLRRKKSPPVLNMVLEAMVLMENADRRYGIDIIGAACRLSRWELIPLIMRHHLSFKDAEHWLTSCASLYDFETVRHVCSRLARDSTPRAMWRVPVLNYSDEQVRQLVAAMPNQVQAASDAVSWALFAGRHSLIEALDPRGRLRVALRRVQREAARASRLHDSGRRDVAFRHGDWFAFTLSDLTDAERSSFGGWTRESIREGYTGLVRWLLAQGIEIDEHLTSYAWMRRNYGHRGMEISRLLPRR
jgi:hypothetical protein